VDTAPESVSWNLPTCTSVPETSTKTVMRPRSAGACGGSHPPATPSSRGGRKNGTPPPLPFDARLPNDFHSASPPPPPFVATPRMSTSPFSSSSSSSSSSSPSPSLPSAIGDACVSFRYDRNTERVLRGLRRRPPPPPCAAGGAGVRSGTNGAGSFARALRCVTAASRFSMAFRFVSALHRCCRRWACSPTMATAFPFRSPRRYAHACATSRACTRLNANAVRCASLSSP